ncbi:heparinase II/III domain-containing protein [Geminisphaera colitermitum]|uniref:heparinase II/III domain-containing protein n=1 Tax=Geminisphaera colitermitum TaxID=1148786 RepID=UPI00019650F7|nr:heparinase II/III family protein [Geminisphaera colitermitum]
MRHSPRRLSLFVLALVALVPAISPASTSALDAPAPKSETKKTSPLWLDAEAVTKIQIQEESDPLMRDLLTAIKRNAGKIAPLPPPVHPGTAKNDGYLNQFRAFAGRLEVNAFLWRLTGEQNHLDLARRDLLAVSAFPDWNPNHFLDTAELGAGTALAWSWLAQDLSAADNAVIRDGLRRNLLALAPRAYQPEGRGGLNWSAFGTNPKTTNNWNFVCNQAFVAAAFVLRDDEPQLSRLVFDGARRSLPLALRGYAPDGVWPESITYWSYGTSNLAKTLDILQRPQTGADGIAALAAAPGLNRTALYALQIFGTSGFCFNFGDGGLVPDRETSAATMTLLARHFNQPEILPETRRRLAIKLRSPLTGYERSLPSGSAGRGLVFAAIFFPAQPENTSPPPPPRSAHFRGDTELVILRAADASPDALWFAIKAGKNGLSHSHLDLGSFVLDALGERWAIDLGSEKYNLPGYWKYAQDGRRWDYYRCNNRGHNTLTFDDALQDAFATTPVTAFDDKGDAPSATLDLTPAWSRFAQKITRTATLAADGKTLLLRDDIAGLRPDVPFVWRMHTRARVMLSPEARSATLTQNGKTLRIEITSSAADVIFDITTAGPPTAAESKNPGVSVLEIRIAPRPAQETNASLDVRFIPRPAQAGAAPRER